MSSPASNTARPPAGACDAEAGACARAGEGAPTEAFRPLRLHELLRVRSRAAAQWAATPWRAVGEDVAGTGGDVEVAVITAWLVALSRLVGETRLGIGWIEDGALPESGGTGAAGRVTQVDIALDPAGDFATACAAVAQAIGAARSSAASSRPVAAEGLDAAVWCSGAALAQAPALGAVVTLQVNGAASTFRLIHDRRRAGPGRAMRLVRYMSCLLGDAGSGRAIDRLRMLPATERRLVIERGNRSSVEFPRQRCVHQVFEAWAQRAPDAIAIVSGARSLTYAQLDAHSTAFARRLVDAGVARGDTVALAMERSVALIVAQLAVLKAGGIYVPIDPALPAARRAWLTADCRAVVSVTCSEDVEAPEGAMRISASSPVAAGDADARGAVSGESGAYVMYTSGSTGTPKGVIVPHRGILRLVLDGGCAQFAPGDRFAFIANPAFDASTLEVWAPLLNGGTVVVMDRETVLSPARLADALQAQQVDMLLLTSGLFSQIHRELGAAIGRLKLLFVGGDTLNPRAVADVIAHHPPQCLLNAYGPTEATVIATTYAVGPDTDGSTAIPIGRPIANTRIYLLDEHGEPVALGAVGEICIGGAGVALGYLNRPDLTEERFLPDPFDPQPGARMYRTGDLARHGAGGQIEFLGRKDTQVKIRGFRIEPAEIEARLLECPLVREASVLVRDDGAGRRLVAYVVAAARAERRALIGAMHAFLRDRLPEYMLPSAFVVLEALALHSSGKVDRRSLPAPSLEDHVSEVYAPPREGMESLLAGLWAGLLGVVRVGRDDNFFALGGHSLLVMQLGSRLRRELGVTMPAGLLFAHPTLAAFAAQVAGLERSGLPPIRPVARRELLLPSFAQQRLWFLAQDDGHGATYHVPVAWRLRGRLDHAALRRSLDRVLARHEALRAVFHAVDGQPRVRLLAADSGVALPQHDLRGDPDPQGRLQALLRQETHARFDLASQPSIRARLIRLQDDEHVLVLTLHHIATDGWSMKLLLRDLGSGYAGAEPPPLDIQYFDYAAWQHQWLTQGHLQPQLAYWRQTLRDAPSLLALPTDRPRPAQQSFAGASLPVSLDAALSGAVRQFARRHGCTPFVVLMAAWAAILGRLSGQDDVVIGTPTANRQDLDVEPLIGFFVNSLPLRVDLSGQPDGAALIARVHALTVAAHEHADVPFERIVEVAQPVRRADCTPLFQVTFAWNSNEAGRLELPGLQVEPVDTGYEAARFDLELDLADGAQGIHGQLHYASALFDAATIERYRGYLVTFVQQMIADDTRPVARIELLSAAERTLQLQTWNANETAFPAAQCIHQVYEQQARRTPDAPAVIDGARSCTYGELNLLANRIAQRLIAHGVRPGDRVFLVAERGLPLVACELAILKAGAAYVPAHTQTPAARLAWMVQDSASVLVLNDDGVAIAGTSTTTLAIAALMAPAAGSDVHDDIDGDPALALSGELAAYVMYTSGSTGTPKGVLIPHRGITRLAINNTFAHYAPGDRVSFCSNPAFDASALDLWPTLLNGATVVVIDQSTLLSTQDFVALLQRTRVDTLWLTIGLFNQMVSALVPIMAQFKTVMTGGDVLDPAKMAEALAGGPGRLVAAYGPTETSVFTTTYLVDKPEPTRPVAIGRPIANTRVYLLDAYGQPVPIGAPGEICIGGAAVGLGYLNRPELTAERFVDDPFNPVAGQRMYRSGDFGRYRSDGNIEFLRRNDGQVKLRGFRVELGEIEMRLGEHEEVEAAAVIVREESPGDKQLVAYVRLAPSAQPRGLAVRLRAYLEEILPDYMVPSAYVQLDELPLTPNGKLDRQALPAPGEDDHAREAYVAPQGRVEQAVAALWAELLELERVSRFDNFFALGGHSLLAVKVLSRINAQFHVGLTIDAIFKAPTVAQLAAVIGADQGAGSVPGRLSTPIPRVARRRAP